MGYTNIQHMSTNKEKLRKKVVVFGTKDLAELAHYYLTNDSEYEVVAFTVNKEYLDTKTFKPRGSKIEYPIVPFEELETHYPPNEYLFFAPMTGVKMNNLRKSIYEEGKEKGYEYISYVSSKATTFDNKIGENCFIFEDNTIQPFTEIGDNVIFWSGNHIGHHGKIEDHVFITSHVVLSGHCLVKERAWIGVNATIRDGLTIGEGSLIAMGAVVTKDTEEDGLYMGSPAKKQAASASKVY
jgi:sugar O-acyltransferase (sialic acid O-acetyltransferase NeuD family)